MPRFNLEPAFRAVLLMGLLAGLLAAPAHEGWAQQLPPRLELPPPLPGPCDLREDPSSPGADPGEEARTRARGLLAEANQAAILGDDAGALGLLRRAAALDPSSGEIAYRLGRMLEEGGDEEEALAEYCRHLSLAPEGPDAAEVEGRVRALGGGDDGVIPASARIAFELGVEALDRGEPLAAALHFSRALVERPEWAEAHYNRALAYLEQGREAAGRADLERFLELEPDAPQAGAATLRARAQSGAQSGAQGGGATSGPVATPRTTLLTGMVLPGMGYVVSGRPRAGALVLGGAGAAAAVALFYTRVDVRCRVPPVAGQCPPDQVAERIEERPFLAPGLAAAALVTVLGAVHASRSVRSAPSGLRVGVDALSGDRWVLLLEVEPHRRQGAEGVDAGLRIRF